MKLALKTKIEDDDDELLDYGIHSNVLCLSLRLTGLSLAKVMVDTWLMQNFKEEAIKNVWAK